MGLSAKNLNLDGEERKKLEKRMKLKERRKKKRKKKIFCRKQTEEANGRSFKRIVYRSVMITANLSLGINY